MPVKGLFYTGRIELVKMLKVFNSNWRLFNQQDLIALRTDKGVHKILPGLTGWAQVNGRDELAIPKKVDLDAEYLAKCNLKFDIYILWLTFLKVIKRDGVSH